MKYTRWYREMTIISERLDGTTYKDISKKYGITYGRIKKMELKGFMVIEQYKITGRVIWQHNKK